MASKKITSLATFLLGWFILYYTSLPDLEFKLLQFVFSVKPTTLYILTALSLAISNYSIKKFDCDIDEIQKSANSVCIYQRQKAKNGILEEVSLALSAILCIFLMQIVFSLGWPDTISIFIVILIYVYLYNVFFILCKGG